MKREFGKTYYAYFYTLIDSKGSWEKHGGELVVNVGLSTNPDKCLRDKNIREKRKNVYALLVKETKEPDYNNLIRNIDEVRAYKSWFYYEPLSDLIKKKCDETIFKPYTLRKTKYRNDKGAEEVLGQLPI